MAQLFAHFVIQATPIFFDTGRSLFEFLDYYFSLEVLQIKGPKICFIGKGNDCFFLIIAF